MPTIDYWLAKATKQLSQAQIKSSRLDSELILSHVINQDRTFLHANGDQKLSTNSVKIANAMLAKRLADLPIAYLTGYKEFYGHRFIVDQSTLIPRPESEILVSQSLALVSKFTPPLKILDLGCGCGSIGLSLAKELEKLNVENYLTLADISHQAINIARQNAQQLNIQPKFVISDLLSNLNYDYHLMIANLPYVNRDWTFIKGLSAEPELALFATDNGLFLIKKLLVQLSKLPKLEQESFILLESDPSQLVDIKNFAINLGFDLIVQRDYLTVLKN